MPATSVRRARSDAWGTRVDAQGRGVRRIAMVVYGDVSYDSRVQREATTLVQAGHGVTIFCLAGSPATMRSVDARVEVRPVGFGGDTACPTARRPFSRAHQSGGPLGRARWLATYVRNLVSWSRSIRRLASGYDTWHVHDFTGLVAAWIAEGPVRVRARVLTSTTCSSKPAPAPVCRGRSGGWRPTRAAARGPRCARRDGQRRACRPVPNARSGGAPAGRAQLRSVDGQPQTRHRR